MALVKEKLFDVLLGLPKAFQFIVHGGLAVGEGLGLEGQLLLQSFLLKMGSFDVPDPHEA